MIYLLGNTGERIIPELMEPMNGMLLEHLSRYYFAQHYARGRVLDIACGSGYGSKMIAKAKKKEISHLVGIDLSMDAINYASHHYYHPLLSFKQGDVMDPRLVEKHGTFDTIISFETIEHIKDDRGFMDQLEKLLNPGGILILSTPFGLGRGIPSKQPFHHQQLTKEEFRELFTSYANVQFYFQRGVLIEPSRENEYYPIGLAVATKAK